MFIRYDKEKLTKIIEDIAELTGISIAILDNEYNFIAGSKNRQTYCTMLQEIEEEFLLCKECDNKLLNKCRASKKSENHICRAGLYDFAMPIIKEEVVVGYVLMGQVRSVNSPDFSQYVPNVESSIIEKLEDSYKKTPFLSKNRLMALYDLLPRILFDNAIYIIQDDFMNKVIEFIDGNICKDLSLELLCSEFYVSKNFLYKKFRDNMDITVNEYIIQQRLRRAKKLLNNSKETVYKISEMVGIDNYAYFCRIFKKKVGVTPTVYRNTN